jgi:nicotinamide-nucleotide amidase
MTPPFARAEIIAVGSELLALGRTDTNSVHITGRLATLGIDVIAKSIVRDHRADLAAAFRLALTRADLVVVTGGLGPTDDDLTREAASDALGVGLHEDDVQLARIQERFTRRGLTMPDINRRQAYILDGAVRLDNQYGTAPGQWLPVGEKAVLLLPGPPREMVPMLDEVMAAHLATRAGTQRTYRRTVRVAGRTESHVESLMQPLYAIWTKWPHPVDATILAAYGRIDVHLFVHADNADEAHGILEEAVALATAVLGASVYATDDRELEQVAGEALKARGWRVATAESCTGGMLGWRLTSVPGSSAWVEGGVIVYSNALKTMLADVPADLIETHGAVSEAVARALARGVRARTGAEVGVAITGVAGPGGGSEAKPVGTVFVAIETPEFTACRHARFVGDRAIVRQQASTAALDMLRLAAEGRDPN